MAPRKCNHCGVVKPVGHYGPPMSKNVKYRCLECEFPRCASCCAEYGGTRAIKVGSSAFVGLQWYCEKRECQDAATVAKSVIRKR